MGAIILIRQQKEIVNLNFAAYTLFKLDKLKTHFKDDTH
jgi:hypothetical protein